MVSLRQSVGECAPLLNGGFPAAGIFTRVVLASRGYACLRRRCFVYCNNGAVVNFESCACSCALTYSSWSLSTVV